MADREEKFIPSISIGFYSFVPAILFFFGWFWPPKELKGESQMLFYGWISSFLIGAGCLLWVWVFSKSER